MRKLKNSYKILSLFLLGIFLISIIILPNINIVDDDRVYDNASILPSEQTDWSLDTTPPQVSAPALKYSQTFNITQSEDDAHSYAYEIVPPLTNHDATNITLGGMDKDNPIYSAVSWGIGFRWNIDVPEYARITRAYINLTVANLTFGGKPWIGAMPWNGFNTSISAFEEASTNDFSNPNEILKLRPLIGDILWELDGTEIINQTLQTVDISDLLQQIMILDGWDGIFGAFIQPGIGTDYNISFLLSEMIQFWAYDCGKPEYYPKLFVEWEYTPHFTDTPEDQYLFEDTQGYPLKWQVWDNEPADFKIVCDVSIPDIPDYDTWSSGWFTYDLPALERGFYNFTAYFNDTDGHLIWDSVIIEAGPPKPVISSDTYKIDRSEDDAWYRPIDPTLFNKPVNYGEDFLRLGGPSDIDSINPNSRVILLRFNTAVPKNVRIAKAYINFTYHSTANYNGFTSKIYLFYPPVADFSDVNEQFTFDPEWTEYRPASEFGVTWNLPAPASLPAVGSVLQTPEITSELQKIIDFGNYDGYIGLYITPIAGSLNNEYINFRSFDYDDLHTYAPTLFVKWEESPYFLSTPADIIAKNGINGYHLDWVAADDNPTTFTITCNDTTVSNIPYEGSWKSGVETVYDWIHMEVENRTSKIQYDLPPLEIGVYNFTIRVNDADLNYILDSAIVKVSDLDLPVLTDIKFIQNEKEVDFFQCGNGPFTIRIYNSTPITPELWLTAYYPEYEQTIYSTTTVGTDQVLVEVYLKGDTVNILKYDESFFSYDDSLGCFKITCPSSDKYYWAIIPWNVYSPQTIQMIRNVNNIEYNVLNRFEIRVNDDDEYIYNQTIYGDIWNRPFEVWNKDLTPPIYLEPNFIEPDDTDKHYEVNIWAGSEAYGAAVESVFLYYSVDDGLWEETKMVLYDGKYYGEIPAQEDGATIDYYIKIIDIAGNVIETEIYHEKAPTFEEPSIIIPIIGIFLGILGSLSIVAIYRHKKKAALKRLTSDKVSKKSTSDTKKGNILIQKLKKVIKKQ